jgi:ligand-binding sensor domain-containing protein/signal transduction histidine kinase/DNA-binding response OmpR family regulator
MKTNHNGLSAGIINLYNILISPVIISIVIISIVIVIYPTDILWALDPEKSITQYNIRYWNMESGLPGNAVTAISQTQDGYLWLGTQDGLVRFDGVNFENFNSSNTLGLRGSVIRALFRDREGILWIGTDLGGLTRYRNGEFYTFTVETHEAPKTISAIAQDRDGSLWVASQTDGLARFSSGSFTSYNTEEFLPSNVVRNLHTDQNHDIWVTTTKAILKILSPGQFSHYATESNHPYFKTAALFNAESGELWIGTGADGMFRLKNDKIIHFQDENGQTGVPHSTINTLFMDRQGILWIGTDGGGVARIKNNRLSRLTEENGLPDNDIDTFYEDKEGSLWIGTLDGGLVQLTDSEFTTFTTRDGLVDDYINCVFQDSGGITWIGTEAGLSRFIQPTAKPGDSLETILPDNSAINRGNKLKHSVLALYEDQSGTLWIGTYGGLYFHNAGKTVKPANLKGLSDPRIKVITGDRGGKIWLGTENGLNRYNPNGPTDSKISVYTTANGLAGNDIELLFPDSFGFLWISTASGMSRMNPDGSIEDKSIDGLAERIVHTAYEDDNGVLWFGTDQGLTRLVPEKTAEGIHHSPYHFTMKSGLRQNVVYAILEDDRNHLWLGGWNGISRIKKQELYDYSDQKIPRLHADLFTEIDGLKSRWCTRWAYKTSDGRFWFPTAVGVTVFSPDKISTDSQAPPPIIEKLTVDGEPMNIRSALDKNIPLPIEPGKKRLDFYYTGISFLNPKRIHFKIKLEGYDTRWVEKKDQRNTTYTGLAPGRYTFRVTAAGPGGRYHQEETVLRFYLELYFYQTPGFYIILSLLIILGAFTFHHIKMKRMRNRQKELAAMVDSRTKDLEERNQQLDNTRKNLLLSKDQIENKNRLLEEQSDKLKELDRVKSRFFANISHEFRTPLTLIMGPLEQMLAEEEQPRSSRETKQLSLMLRNSQRLLTLINQLLELSKYESGKVKLRASLQNIVPLVKGIAANVEPLSTKHQLDLTVNVEKDELFLYVDTEKIENVLYNLLINAVKFTPPGGKITVEVRMTAESDETSPEGALEISVADTGPGIPREQLSHIFDRFFQAGGSVEQQKKGSGIGLSLVREQVLVHHGKIDVYSREGKGTEFIITLPMGDKHLMPGERVTPESGAPKPPSPIPIVEHPVTDQDDTVQVIKDTASLKNNDDKTIILVVEDNTDIRDYIRGSLEPEFSILEAADGEEGLKIAQDIIPDLIISDIMMPKIDGYQLCRKLKKNVATCHIPIIMLTAKASEDSAVQGLETGADDYVTKPFSMKLLTARIKNLIDLRRQFQLSFSRHMTDLPSKIPVSPIDNEFIKELKDVIEKNLSDPDFNVEQLAKKMYMDRSTIYRKIQALTGEPPNEFIRSTRLRRGAELLKNNFGTVLEVALEVGFSSANYFTKCFKKKYHQLPSTYQASESD